MPRLVDSLPLRPQAEALRALFALPQPVRRLAAGPPVRLDGQELALDAQLLLRMQRLVGVQLHASTPAKAREVFDQANGLVAGPPIEGVETRDLKIPGDDGPIPARLYRPAGLAKGSPLLVYYHGGGWVLGSIKTYDNVCRFLSKHANVRVLSVGYRLAPEHRFPAAVDDALAAWRYAVSHARALGATPGAIALGGDSAGGNLAAVTAHITGQEGGPHPVFLLLLCPAVDATTLRRSRELFATGFLLTERDMVWAVDHYCPEIVRRSDPRLSILQADNLGVLPPTYLATAGFDPLRDGGEAFARRLMKAGVPVVLSRQQDLIHGYVNMIGLGRRFREAMFEAAHALRTGLALGAEHKTATVAAPQKTTQLGA